MAIMVIKKIMVKTMAELRGWLMSDADEWAGEGVTPIRPSDTFPQIKTIFGGSYAVRVFCFGGQSQTLTELRGWLMSAGDEWAGEGVTPHLPPNEKTIWGKLRCESFLLRRAIPNADGIARLADVRW